MRRVCSLGWVHRSNIGELLEFAEKDAAAVLGVLGATEEPYDVVKFDRRNRRLSLITCPEFDSVWEPGVEDVAVYRLGRWKGSPAPDCRTRRRGCQVYHRREDFVAPGYAGFDLEAARRRTRMLSAIPGLDRRRAMYASYWAGFLADHGIPSGREAGP